jgi:hypothetical protein
MVTSSKSMKTPAETAASVHHFRSMRVSFVCAIEAQLSKSLARLIIKQQCQLTPTTSS